MSEGLTRVTMPLPVETAAGICKGEMCGRRDTPTTGCMVVCDAPAGFATVVLIRVWECVGILVNGVEGLKENGLRIFWPGC